MNDREDMALHPSPIAATEGGLLPSCQFVIAYVGRCPQPATENGYCEQHSAVKCRSCGAQANRECCYAGQFVCGAPLCANCEGFEDRSKESGAWGFLNHGHRPKEKPAEETPALATRTPAPSLGEDVVERVARALADKHGIRSWDDLCPRGFFCTPRFIGKDYWFEQAETALSSMRPVQEEGVDLGPDDWAAEQTRLPSKDAHPEASPPSLGVEGLREALEAVDWQFVEGAVTDSLTRHGQFTLKAIAPLRRAIDALSRVSGGV